MAQEYIKFWNDYIIRELCLAANLCVKIFTQQQVNYVGVSTSFSKVTSPSLQASKSTQ